ncbi:MAG: diguanylate cyclase [Phaeospirillum sp.]|nr:diguanylate cyclase [Phaeospirillum sp.]
MQRLKWVAAFVAILLVYNAALGGLAWWQRSDLLGDSLREAVVVAEILANDVESSIDRVDRTLSGVGEVLRALPSTQELHDPYAHRFLIRRHAISPVLRSLFLVGPDGKLRNSSSMPQIAPIDVSDRDYFKAHLKGGNDGIFIGPAIKDRIDSNWLIPVSQAVEDQFGRVAMVVGGFLIPEAIEQMIASHRLPDGFRVAITLRDGSPIGCWGIPSCPVDLENNGPAIAGSFPTVERANGAFVSYLPGKVGVGAFVREERYGIAVAVQADNEQILRSWKSKLWLMLGLAVLGSIGLAGGTVALHHQMRHRRLAMLQLEQANAFLETKVAERVKDLTEGEERMRGFIMAARDAVVIIDQCGIISEFNPSATELFGYSADEVRGQSVNMLMPDNYAREHDGHLKKGKPSGLRAIGRGREMVGRRKNGSEFPIELTVGTHPMGGGRVHVGVIRDITERKANEDTLRRLANTDGLTGVLNRRSFTEEGNRLFTLAERHGRDLAVLMIDADHFKVVNDTHGHDIGDVVLKALAREVVSVLRTSDIFGRLGGEEFAALLPETDPVGAEDLAWKVVEAVRGLSVPLPGGGTLTFTISVGIGCRHDGIPNLDAVLKESDKALYVAKQSGRNRAVRQAPVDMK